MSAVGYEWIMKAYIVNIMLPIELMILSFTTEAIKKETKTSADPR